jgi:hypothetical protein
MPLNQLPKPEKVRVDPLSPLLFSSSSLSLSLSLSRFEFLPILNSCNVKSDDQDRDDTFYLVCNDIYLVRFCVALFTLFVADFTLFRHVALFTLFVADFTLLSEIDRCVALFTLYVSNFTLSDRSSSHTAAKASGHSFSPSLSLSSREF